MAQERLLGNTDGNFDTPKDQMVVLLDSVSAARPTEARPNFQAADELVRFVTQSDNHLGTIRAINKSYACIQAGNSIVGKRILSRLDQYYQDLGVSYKFVLPEGEDAATQMREAITEYNEYVSPQNVQDYYRFTPRNTGFLAIRIATEFENAINANLDPSRTVIGYFYIQPHQVKPWDKMWQGVRDQVEQHRDIFNLVRPGAAKVVTNAELATVPENFITLARNFDQLPPTTRGKSEIMTRSFGGVTLQSLVLERDPTRFSQRLLRYLAHIPTGDLFWTFAKEAAFLPLTSCIDRNTGDIVAFRDPDYSRKIYSFHWWLTQKLLLPAFRQEYRDPRFDKEFGELLNTADTDFIIPIGNVVNFEKSAGPYRSGVRDERFTLGNPRTYSPFLDIALEASESGIDSLWPSHSYVFQDLFRKNKGKIIENLQERFPNNATISNIIAQLVIDIDRDIEDSTAFAYTTLLNNRFTVGHVFQHVNNIVQLSEVVLGEYSKSTTISPYPATDDVVTPVYSINFPEEVNLDSIAISNVYLSPIKDSLAIKLLFVYDDQDGGIEVEVDDQGGIRVLFSGENSSFSNMFGKLASIAAQAYFHKFPVQESVIVKPDVQNENYSNTTTDREKPTRSTESKKTDVYEPLSPAEVTTMLKALRNKLEQL